MRYVGGKSRLAKSLSEVILSSTTNRSRYVEPFIGGGSVFAKLAPSFASAYGADLSPDIAALWQGVFNEGFVPPETVSESEYQQLRDAEPSALRGYVGFGGSFGGKWFGGYARGGVTSTGEPRNHQGESARAIMKIAKQVSGTAVTIKNSSYLELELLPGDVVYCDPPYASTQGYSTGVFDSEEFWNVMDRWSDNGATVFVSEYQAPEGWNIVWEQQHRQSLSHTAHRQVTSERLFQHQ